MGVAVSVGVGDGDGDGVKVAVGVGVNVWVGVGGSGWKGVELLVGEAKKAAFFILMKNGVGVNVLVFSIPKLLMIPGSRWMISGLICWMGDNRDWGKTGENAKDRTDRLLARKDANIRNNISIQCQP